MKPNIYVILMCLLPVIFILFQLWMISSIDSKLIHVEKSVEGEKRVVNPLNMTVSIEMGGVRVNYKFDDKYVYNRQYTGIIQQVIAYFHFKSIKEKSLSTVSFYAFNKKEDNKKKLPFFYLNSGMDKGFKYHLDVYAYVKKIYLLPILVVFFVCFVFLFVQGSKMDGGLSLSQTKLTFSVLAFVILYIFL